jgi:hypothetical protein
MVETKKKTASRIFEQVKDSCTRNKLVVIFFIAHVLFAIFLGRLFAFAPDEQNYLYTFNNVYTLPVSTDAQSGSGWNAAPTVFLWIAYLPAKILNLAGVPDFLSIRLLSIAITTISLFLLLRMKQNTQKLKRIPEKLIFFSFFIPSVFLWTSTGLRESFLIFEITLFLAGLNFLFIGKTKKAIFLLFVGSYGLVSTKPYLWMLLIISIIIFSIVALFWKIHRNQMVKLLAAGFVAPLILFSCTGPIEYLVNFFDSDITEVGLRSGNSLLQFETQFETQADIDGGYTLIALHFYLLYHPDSAFSKTFRVLNLDDKVESMWNEKLQAGLISEGKQVGKETSSINSHILKPGLITEPLTMLWPAFVFLAGPFPIIGEPGIAAKLSSFESPLWWLLYGLVIYQFYRFRKFRLFRDPATLFTLIFLAGEIAFSSLAEVNLGTSFRHRSILLVPLVFLYVRITQRAHELSNADSRQTT